MQIPPINRRDLLRTSPAFELRLPRHRPNGRRHKTPVQQSPDVVFVNESLKMMEFVSEHAFLQIAAEPDVQHARQASMM